MHLDASRISARSGKGAGLAFVAPCLPKLVAEPPSGSGWFHEIKHDGHRTIVVVADSRARAFTRNGYDWTDRYRRIVDHAAELTCRSAVLDGEMVVQDKHGVSDFGALRGAMAREPHRLVFFAFDLLHLDDEDLRTRVLSERKARLRKLLGKADPLSPIQFCEHVEGDGTAVFAAAERMGLEGIVSKQARSLYRSGTSTAWLKTKCMTEGEFIVLGMAPGEGGPPFALLAREEDGRLVYAGSAFVTLSRPARDVFWSRTAELVVEKPALKQVRRQKATWVRPELRVRARHLKGGDMLRHGVLTEVL